MKRRAAIALIVLALAAPPSALATCIPITTGRDLPTTLVLSGGGAKGAYEAGAVAALAEHGLPIRLVAGSSAGALTAAMVVAGRADRLEATWRAITQDQVYAMRVPTFFAGLLPGWLTLRALRNTTSLLDPRPLRELITGRMHLLKCRRAATPPTARTLRRRHCTTERTSHRARTIGHGARGAHCAAHGGEPLA